MELFSGRPVTNEGRQDKEIRVYDLLDRLQVTYERLDHAPAMTMEVCSEIEATLVSRLSFASREHMEELLDITPGSVSVMGLMNDVGHKVQLVIDADVLKSEYFGCHPCINTSSIRLRTKDLMEKVIPAMDHEPIIVDLGSMMGVSA